MHRNQQIERKTAPNDSILTGIRRSSSLMKVPLGETSRAFFSVLFQTTGETNRSDGRVSSVCLCVFFLLFLRVSFAYGYVDQTIVVGGAYLFERALLLCVQVNVAHCICLGFVILAGRGEDSTRR